MKTNNRKIIENELRQIFKELCPTEEDLKETVRDAMSTYSLVKQQNYQRSNTI